MLLIYFVCPVLHKMHLTIQIHFVLVLSCEELEDKRFETFLLFLKTWKFTQYAKSVNRRIYQLSAGE